jgi:hypothetical protein
MALTPAEIAEAVGAPTTAFKPLSGNLSTLFSWFGNAETLCVIAGTPQMKAQDWDKGFSHALGHLGDRDLIVVFPPAGAKAVSERLPFLEVPARVYALTDDTVTSQQPLRPADVLADYKGVRGGSHDITKAIALVEPLLSWLAPQKELVQDDRKSYRTWQYQGRQVLTLQVGSGGHVDLVAGVNYSDPKPGQVAAERLRLTQAITGAQLATVQAAIALARAGKDSGEDAANAEHLLQERLRSDWKLLGLKGAPLREVPVRRPVGYGYIDLLGAGRDGRIRIIETKLGPFVRLVMQGLDYWIWVTANAPDVADWLGLPAGAGIDIEYVVAEKTAGHGVIGSYTSGQAEAIQGSIRWRFTTIRDWRGSHAPTIERLALRTPPPGSKGRPAPRKAPRRWSVELARHLAARAEADGVTLGGGVFWPNASDGLEPAAALVHEQLAAEGLAHHMVGHVRSSQAFALNLFAPLDAAGRVAVAKSVGIDAVDVGEPRFEWSDPHDALGERTHASPHATQVDVVLDCATADGKKTALLIEVKLSEHDFNGCSAWLAPANDRLDVCNTSGPFGCDTAACFQLRNHGREHRRKYDTALGPLTVATDGEEGGCWFRFGGNQPMRNVALARTLVSRGDVDDAVVALCAPRGHRAIWRRWDEAKAHLAAAALALVDMPAEAVVSAHAFGAALAERYLLDPSAEA